MRRGKDGREEQGRAGGARTGGERTGIPGRVYRRGVQYPVYPPTLHTPGTPLPRTPLPSCTTRVSGVLRVSEKRLWALFFRLRLGREALAGLSGFSCYVRTVMTAQLPG